MPTPSPVDEIIKFFAFEHLKHAKARTMSEKFAKLAHELANEVQNRELTVALRKLLEAKDAAVRAVL